MMRVVHSAIATPNLVKLTIAKLVFGVIGLHALVAATVARNLGHAR